MLLVFAYCALLTNAWAIIRYLYDLPRFLIMLPVSKIVGLFTYFATVALFDALMMWSLIVVLAIILPTHWLREAFNVQGIILASLLWVWVMLNLRWTIELRGSSFFMWSIVALIGAIAITAMLGAKRWQLSRIVLPVAERLSILAYLYIVVDVVSLLWVIVRNVGAL